MYMRWSEGKKEAKNDKEQEQTKGMQMEYKRKEGMTSIHKRH